jgi:hypothetical protein
MSFALDQALVRLIVKHGNNDTKELKTGNEDGVRKKIRLYLKIGLRFGF